MNEPSEKSNHFTPQRSRRHLWLGILALLVVASSLVGFLGIPGTGGPARIAARGGKVSIPLATLNDGQAHFFSYSGKEGKIPFFVIKGTDGKLRVAFDTCDVCYKEKKGYKQEGTQMVCKNCNMAFPVAKIGEVSGGCNPTPIKSRQSGANLEIDAAELEAGAFYFR